MGSEIRLKHMIRQCAETLDVRWNDAVSRYPMPAVAIELMSMVSPRHKNLIQDRPNLWLVVRHFCEKQPVY